MGLTQGRPRKGQNTFTYALAALARLMGHGGPIITLEAYVHVVDWLLYCINKKTENEKAMSLSVKKLSYFCQVSEETIRELIKADNIDLAKVTPSQLLGMSVIVS